MSEFGTSRWKFSPLAAPLFAIGMLSFFVYCALFRLIAGDEGFYLYASQLVMQGKVPYRDFFYPQTPLLPYVYGFWLELWGYSWGSARSLSALLSCLLGLLIYQRAARVFGVWYGALAVFFFCTSRLSLTQLVLVKSYALSAVLLFMSYLAIERVSTSGSRRSWNILCGVFLGLAVNMRLMVLPLVALLILALFAVPEFRPRAFRQSILIICGLLLAALPTVVPLLQDPELWWFNNIGYHLGRTQLAAGEVHEKVLGVLSGLRATEKFSGFLFPWLCYTGLGSLWFLARRRFSWDFAVVFFPGLLLLNLLPNPAYVEYQCLTEPFMIICALYTIRECISAVQSRHSGAAAVICLTLLVLSLRSAVFLFEDIKRYTENGRGVLGLRGRPDRWSIQSVKAVTALVNRVIKPGDLVLSLWPGYLFGSDGRALPGLENHFALTYTRNNVLSENVVERLKLVTEEGIKRQLHQAQAVVVPSGGPKNFLKAAMQEKLFSGFWQESGRAGGVAIFKRSPETPVRP